MVQISDTIAYREASARWSALNELCFNLGISTNFNEEAGAIRTDFYGFTIYGRGYPPFFFSIHKQEVENMAYKEMVEFAEMLNRHGKIISNDKVSSPVCGLNYNMSNTVNRFVRIKIIKYNNNLYKVATADGKLLQCVSLTGV